MKPEPLETLIKTVILIGPLWLLGCSFISDYDPLLAVIMLYVGICGIPAQSIYLYITCFKNKRR